MTAGDPQTSVSRCHGDVTGRRTVRTGLMRRTALLVSLFATEMEEIRGPLLLLVLIRFFSASCVLRWCFISNNGNDRW